MSSVSILLLSTLVLSAPLILAAMGGLTSERSGVMNIALEGFMLVAACVYALVSTVAGTPWIGAVAGIAAATLMSLAHWVLTQKFRLDHVIGGMALNLIALGGTNYLYVAMPDRVGPANGIPSMPGLTVAVGSGIRVELTPYMAVAYAAPFLIAWYLRRSRAGLRLSAVGQDPDKARMAGVNPLAIRFWGLLATGVLTGIAGAMLADNADRFTDNMTAGRGYIALAALIVGGWRPVQAMLSCLLFGLLDALQLQLQGTKLFGAVIPSEAWSSLPYVATVVVLAGFLGKSRAPLGLGKP